MAQNYVAAIAASWLQIRDPIEIGDDPPGFTPRRPPRFNFEPAGPGQFLQFRSARAPLSAP